MRNLAALLTLLLVSAAQAGVTIRQATVEGRTAVVLENDYLRAVFSPEKGGECTDLVFKPADQRLVLPGEGSLLGSRVWNYADPELYRQWQQSAWEYKIGQTTKQVRLTMHAPGKVGFTRSTTFVKQITLDADEAMLRVEHTLDVGQELMQPQKIGLWFANRCGVVGQQNRYCFPLDDGVARLDPAAGLAQEWFYNPARGWVAAVGGGTGLALNMEFRRLMCFYLSGGRQPTLEWAFRTVDVPHGGSLRTEELIVPFAGVAEVHGSDQGIVAGLIGPEKCSLAEAEQGLRVQAVLAAGCRASGQLVVELRRLPDGKGTELCRLPVRLEPAKTLARDLHVRIDREGTWLLSGRLVAARGELVDFQRPIVVGAPSGPVRMAAKVERIGRPSERFEDQLPVRGTAPKDIELSTAVGSDHVPWARPYHRGRLRVMVLTSCLSAREAVELAERLDMEIVHVSAGLQSELDSFSGVFGPNKSFKVEHTNQYIREQLARPCDAILIGGLRGDLLVPEVIELLRRKVNEGLGLVYAGPNNLPDALADLLGIEKVVHPRRRDGAWQAVRPHFLTTGVPWAELPKTDYADLQAKGQPLATVGQRRPSPLLTAQDGPGRGRVVVLNYNTSWQGSGSWKSGITPWVGMAEQKFKYWEYYFSVLAKSLLWASHREPEIALEQIAVDTTAARPKLVARLAGRELPLEAEIRLWDAYGTTEHEAKLPLAAHGGSYVLEADLPADLPAGLHLADVIFRSQGKAVTWGTAAVRLPGPTAITRLSFDKTCYRSGERVTLAVEGKADRVILRAEFSDSLGRLLWRGQQERAALADGRPAEFAFTLPTPLATLLTARVTALRPGAGSERRLAVAQADCIMLPEKFAARAWDDWESCIWGSAAGAYEREYLVPLRTRMYREFGITTVQAAAQWPYDTEFAAAVRAGFQIMPMGVSFGLLNVGHRAPKGKIPFDEARSAYQKTHDKKYLVRPISLNDPADLVEVGNRLGKVAEYCAWLEPIGYNLGDEMGTTHYVTPFDYDFGAPALAAFRVWLRERYGTLAALNAQWDTQHATWDQVAPLTAVEVKDRGNYAPWADHREFMDVTFANFFRWVRERLREKDPRATVGMSGSQAAEAYGGYDWSRLTAAVDFLQSYTHQDTIVMHRSFDGRVPRVPWYGYMAVNPQIRQFLWRCLLNENCGGSYYVDSYLFLPDYTMTRSTHDAWETVAEFQRGLAKLLHSARRVNDVGVHYSHPSIRGAFITGADALFRDNRAGWVLGLQDAGLQCEFLSTAQLEAGELVRRHYPVFVLPCSMALSAGEVSALRAYVEAGGLLVADAKAGLMDEHCRTLKAGRLDDLFGVARTQVDPSRAPIPAAAHFSRDVGACKLVGLDLDVAVAEPELRLAGGTPLGEHDQTPLVVVNQRGKGMAVLLNFFLDGYPRRRELHLEQTMGQLVENLLRLGRLRPEVSVECSSVAGRAGAAHCYVVRYRSGAAQYVAVQHDLGEQKEAEPAEATISLPPAGCVYDVRTASMLGRVAKTTARIAPGDTKLYALLPYQVNGVTVQAADQPVAPGATVDYRVAIECDGQPAGHLFLVEISGPDGKPRPHYARKLMGQGGSAAGRLTLALNDSPGTWTIRATDMVSGKSGTCRLVVKPSARPTTAVGE